MFWNKRLNGLEPYTPGEQPPPGARVIKLNTNEHPCPPPPEVLAAIAEASGRLRLYPDPSARALREAAAARFSLPPECVFAANGSDEALAFCFGAFFPEAGEAEHGIRFPDITYSFYKVFAKLWNVPYKTVPLNDDFTLNLAAYDTPNDGIIFPNPNAPTGIALAAADVLDLARLQAARARLLIIDEAYIDFGAEPVAPHITRFDNLIVTRTLSKGAGLAGLRAGYALASPALIRGLERIRDSFNSYPLDTLACAGAAAALRCRAHYDAANAAVAATRERVALALREAGWRTIPSKANFILVRPPAPLLRPPDGARAVYEALRARGILTRHFPEGRLKDYLRVSIGGDDDMDVFLRAAGELG